MKIYHTGLKMLYEARLYGVVNAMMDSIESGDVDVVISPHVDGWEEKAGIAVTRISELEDSVVAVRKACEKNGKECGELLFSTQVCGKWMHSFSPFPVPAYERGAVSIPDKEFIHSDNPQEYHELT